MALPHLMASLPKLTLHPSIDKGDIDPRAIATQWLSSLENHLKDATISSASKLFLPSNLPYWRDILGLSWDWSTKKSSQSILSQLSTSSQGFGSLEVVESGALQPALVDMEGVVWTQSGITFRNRYGWGRGLLRLVNDDDGKWKAWTVFTQLEGLYEQQVNGTLSSGSASRDDQDEFQALVIGAGQSGLAIGAHLKHLRLEYLIVEKNHRVGDSWRARYESIRAHTPKYSDHYPFLPYPEDFPQWLGGKQIADWQEHYAKTVQLNIKLATSAQVLGYDEISRKHTVQLYGPSGQTRIVRCKHLILAAGMFSTTPIIPSIPNREAFTGEVYHTVSHKSAARISDVEQKSVVCIGSGTSSHDVAEDFVRAGAQSVTMLQRYPIITVTRESYIATQMSLWDTPGIVADEADIIGNSFPFPVVRALNIPATQKMNEMDRQLLDPMRERGYRVLENVGLVDQQFLKGGHFYIDQGACEMIADGRIGMVNCEAGIKGFAKKGLILADGKEVEADFVVLGTGFESMGKVVEEIMGKEVAERVGDIGHLDEEGERIGWWRPTGVPGLWYMTGSFLWTRTFSAILALQITAVERGLNFGYYDRDVRSRKKAD